jgi:transcriptional regulator with XRE-family HTH domain
MSNIRYNRLAIVLKEFNISQKELAELLGAKDPKKMKDRISGWCKNRHQPSLQVLYKIAYVLRIDIRLLIEPTDWSHEKGPSPVELKIAAREAAILTGRKGTPGIKTKRKAKN